MNIFNWLHGQAELEFIKAGISKSKAVNLSDICISKFKSGEIRNGKEAMRWVNKEIKRQKSLESNKKAR